MDDLQDQPNILKFVVGKSDEPFKGEVGMRVDQFLQERLKDFSRSRLQKIVSEGGVLVNEKIAKAGQKLKNGQVVSVTIPPLKDLEVTAENIPIRIRYEDKYLAVVEKPAGMVTHPGAGVDSGTLVHALMHHMKGDLSGISGVLRPGIVHRLDKDTSGLLLIAKEDSAHRHLAKQIQSKEARRIYLAVLEGVPSEGEGKVVAPLGRDPKNRTRIAIVSNGRNAETSYRILKSTNKFALAELQLSTGRTHQIRVHMQSLKCPVVGDIVYNHKTTGTLDVRRKLGLIGHALHAHRLSFRHPLDGRLLEFEAALPEDISRLVDQLF
jgi:23S rRNA pseudouridine1911/1915/1917 synthase